MASKEKEEVYAHFVKLSSDIAYLQGACELLEWDMETTMPLAGAEGRARALAVVSALVHEKSVSREYEDCLTELKSCVEMGRLSPVQTANVEAAWEAFKRNRLLPGSLVEETAEAIGAAHHVWVSAREESDFEAFRPTLERIISLKRQEAAMLHGGRAGSPYDALIHRFERGSTVESLTKLFMPLRDFLPDFIRRIGDSGHAPDPKKVRIAAPVRVQEKLGLMFAETIGFDFNAGRLAVTVHPCMSTMHPGDHRIATRYDEHDCLSSISSVVHEAGHAMYEQGLPRDQFGLASGSACTMGVHESQSRLWEIFVGHSREFWKFYTPRLSEFGVMFDSDVDALYRAVNVVRPSLIRVDADEVTYSLHVLMRFEIERDLIEGKLEVADLPEAWSEKVRDYLDIEVPDDAQGVLQDVHWSSGLIGYFPSYCLGDMAAAQLYAAVSRDIPNLPSLIEKGDFRSVREWLGEKIWRHGAVHTPYELIRLATGESFSPASYMDYVERKYTEIYGL